MQSLSLVTIITTSNHTYKAGNSTMFSLASLGKAEMAAESQDEMLHATSSEESEEDGPCRYFVRRSNDGKEKKANQLGGFWTTNSKYVFSNFGFSQKFSVPAPTGVILFF